MNQFSACFLMSAGLGTRMEGVANGVPKVLLPLLGKTVLEWQLEYLSQFLGIQTFYINVHYRHMDIVQKVLRLSSAYNIHVLYENELLGTGGAIHNLLLYLESRRDSFSLPILVMNSDQFYFLTKKDWLLFAEEGQKKGLLLLGIYVQFLSELSNVLISETKKMKEIIPWKHLSPSMGPYLSYSGNFMFTSDFMAKKRGLTREIAYSSLFETVAPYLQEDVSIFIPSSSSRYLDVGSKKRYLNLLEDLEKNNIQSLSQLWMEME